MKSRANIEVEEGSETEYETESETEHEESETEYETESETEHEESEEESEADSENELDDYPLDSRENRRTTANLLTQLQGAQQQGRVPKAYPVLEPRPYRSFDEDREAQRLRHVASQLFLHANNASLIEIQVMHLRGGSLFIAGNPISVMKSIIDSGVIQEKFKDWLIKPVQGNAKKAEDLARSKRAASKLKSRVFSDNPQFLEEDDDDLTQDQVYAKGIDEFLVNAEIDSLELAYERNGELLELTAESEEAINAALDEPGKIYLVSGECSPHPTRHAEEFLCDILNVARDKDEELTARIGGKKRPCMGCEGRLIAENVDSNPRPGRLWINTIEYQPEEVARHTIEQTKNPAYVSLGKDGKPYADQDTGSDSEPEPARRLRR